MKHECILCSFQKDCADNAIFLYAATPILQQIVTLHLRSLGAEFQFENELFKISSNYQVAITELRNRLSEPERADIRVSRERGGALLAAQTLEAYGRHVDTAWFDKALQNDEFTSFFQPIADVKNRKVFGHECLIRLFSDRPYNGGEIVQAAFERGSIHLFDSYARRLSIRKAGQTFIPGTKVFINFMPSAIYDPAFCMASTLEEMSKTVLQPADVVFEVVESDEVHDVKHLQKICNFYRKEGFGFALDDVGTGTSSLQMICDLQPDYIKLDKSFISHVDEPMYRSVVEKLTEFATSFGLKVIAEGVEKGEDAETLLNMGINLMQGWYFGKPGPRMVPELPSASNDLAQINNQLGNAVRPEQPVSSCLLSESV